MNVIFLMEWSFFGLVGIFFTGLALNLTPCVYPMLSVTVALFGVQRERQIGTAFLRAFVYVLGMVLIYSLLGIGAAFTGQLFGSALQNPPILIVFSVLMFLLALSMFGFYELQVPSLVLNWVGGNRRAGLFGVFLSGLLVGAFAAPCIGPPIVALLAFVGQSANPFSGFLVFFILALGLGFPYLLLGTFSGLLAKLPKSGEWLVWVKKVFGVMLFGLALYYLALALYVDFLPFVIPVTLLGGGLYLGFLDPSGSKSSMFKGVKRFTGIFAVALALLIFFWRSGGERVVWEPYQADKLAMAKKAGKPVVLDFYADWCLSCHELDRFTYSNPNVIAALEPFVRLKVDLTNPNAIGSAKLIQHFSIIGVPTILFLDSKGEEVSSSRITGYASPKSFLAALHPLQLSLGASSHDRAR